MNLVHGHTFDLLARRALYLGASSFGYSSAKNKKYFVVYEGEKINFGDKRYQDFLIHVIAIGEGFIGSALHA